MIVLLLLGFAALAAGTWRQSRLLFGAVPPTTIRRGLLGIGFALIAGSGIAVLCEPDAARRLVEWFGMATLAALGVVAACWIRDRA